MYCTFVLIITCIYIKSTFLLQDIERPTTLAEYLKAVKIVAKVIRKQLFAYKSEFKGSFDEENVSRNQAPMEVKILVNECLNGSSDLLNAPEVQSLSDQFVYNHRKIIKVRTHE